MLKDQLFKKDDDLEEILLHKIKKSKNDDNITFSISIWSSSGSVNIEEIGERINNLDYKKLNDELKSYYFTTDDESQNIRKVKDGKDDIRNFRYTFWQTSCGKTKRF